MVREFTCVEGIPDPIDWREGDPRPPQGGALSQEDSQTEEGEAILG